MKTPEKRSHFQPKNAGFTRADLLALLVVVAVLVMLTMPSLGRVSQKSTITQCAANLQQYDLAMQIYGNENQDNLPNFQNGGEWAWDTSAAVVAAVTNTGVKWTSLYCPGTSARFNQQDDFALFNWEPTALSVLGYATTIPNTPSMTGSPYTTNLNVTTTLQRINYLSTTQFIPVVPATRVLVADATLTPSGSSSVYATMLTYNWVDTQGGYIKPHLSAHLSGTIPLGGNVGMLDGHVEWRNFNQMVPRAGPNNGAPSFYW